MVSWCSHRYNPVGVQFGNECCSRYCINGSCIKNILIDFSIRISKTFIFFLCLNIGSTSLMPSALQKMIYMLKLGLF